MTTLSSPWVASPFIISPKKQQEEFSIAYIHAIVATAGFSLESVRVDEDSIDVRIVQRGQDADNFPLISGLLAQLKCTYAHPPDKGFLKYPLPVKNYHDLRRKCIDARILIIVHIPAEDRLTWLQHGTNDLTLQHTAYWLSLRDQPSTTNTDTITVSLPVAQKFTVSSLTSIMNLLANGNLP